MACCQKQSPQRDDCQLPRRGDSDQTQLTTVFASAALLPLDDLGHGSTVAAFFSDLASRLAPPTLQSQHICMQV
jgi:hypothetical protein